MTSLFRVRTVLSGFPGGPGLATMYFLNTNTCVPSVRAFWAAVAPGMPANVSIQVQNTGDEIESTTGALVGAFTKDTVLPVTGGNVAGYSAPTGALVTWLTSTIVDSRRLRGRTFIVPYTSQAFETNGSLAAFDIAALQSAAQALLFEQSLSFVIWHRPREAKAATPTSLAVTARSGSHGLITGHRVPDKAVVLRSRRD